jgi:hypothetical protein
MPEVGRRSREVRNEYFPEIIWEHSHVVVDDSGTVKSSVSTTPRARRSCAVTRRSWACTT